MTFDRRLILGAGLGLGAAATTARATEKRSPATLTAMNATDVSLGLAPDDGRDQTAALQAAVDAAAEKDVPLALPPGTYIVRWGSYMRDVAATGNVIRHARVGISVTGATDAGKCLIANNLISDAKEGAIREMQFGEMTGPDLVHQQGVSNRVQLAGNVAV